MTSFLTRSSGTRRVAGALLALAVAAGASPAAADNATPAKALFGAAAVPSAGSPVPYGSYAKGCIEGAQALPVDGPNWQVMRLSRNRNWGHPELLSVIQRLSRDGVREGWPGLLVGDISQPRGGPMTSGHASHQIGLDTDIWLTPMPNRRLSASERDQMPFTSMLAPNKFLTIDDSKWTPAHARLIMKAASYPEVARIFVNPAIKKRLCETWTGNRNLLGKVRPIYGHDAHFHIRISCPAGASGCQEQAAPPSGDDCGKNLAWWFTKEPWAAPKKDPNAPPPKPPRAVTLADLPRACSAVLAAAPSGAVAASAYAPSPAAPAAAGALLPGQTIPVPRARPAGR
ncbi:penicillin-insensitive murein endopeptidase [Rhizobiaceae bacterium BDR2-2]|uniref:Penicillin-insensitive murein endopeptidase n=1 Tax=Ectorhizobium quercum TaxID=2965071 RepID=A0AAE3MY97_9HYPH|nr:penicillin-insensitive murein endopeptidase [Ectorhizobium quercum]MCX8995657.1 penicillin-insensitive murein endopeptidase [Ectorhizobium quercum]